jgi:membrane protein DedA with SNARE-associated domain
VIVAVAVAAAIAVSSLRFVQVAFESLDIFVVITLFLVNWLGNGGVLVPIPGARFIGLLMVFQQAVVLPAWEVVLVAGAAMGIGQLSYYVAGARTAESYATGDDAGAEKIAADTGMSDDSAREFSPGAELDADIVTALADVGPSKAGESGSEKSGWRSRFSTSLKRAQDRAQPILEQRGTWGMFLLCFAPTPLGTASAYVGGLMGFGFRRYIVSSFAAKYLLTVIIVLLALVFGDTAQAVALPEIELPQIDWPEFDLRIFELPDFFPAATPGTSPEPGASGAPPS